MKKNIALTILTFLMAQMVFAAEIGYVDMQRVVNSYPLAQQYKREVNKKYDEITKFTKQQEKELSDIKDKNERLTKKVQAFAKVEQKQKEYIDLRKRREDEITNNVKKVADKIREEKKLDIIIKKESAISGGVDITQEVINRLK